MNYTIYDLSTGKIEAPVSFGDEETAQLNLSDKNYISGLYSADEYYISNNKAVSKGPNPSSITQQWQFNYDTKSWILIKDYSSDIIRTQRNTLLSEIDKINPIWYAELTTQQQTELAHYRQLLLDVPQQAGFPITVSWPAKPTWLA
tara:strand:+ start:95 stop:532 length:438 start_codon:yes stop_codon:yes gene_type:complete